VRVGQQHAATVERALAANRHRVTASVEGKPLLTRIRKLERLGPRHLRDGVRWCGAGQGFGKLSDSAFDQQAPRELHQILGGNRAHPFTLALRRQTLGLTLGQRTVVARHITVDKVAHFSGLRLPETGHRLRGIEPVEKQIAGQVRAFFEGELIRAEVA